MTDTDKNSPVDFSDFNAFMWDCHKARQTKMHNDYLYMFYVEMSKPLDPSDYNNGWVTLYIKYEMSKFSLYAGITDKPLPDFRELSKGFIEIPQTFADQIKTNQSFIKTLTIRLNEYAKTRGKEGASFDKVFDVLKTKQISVQRNNSIAKAMEHNKKLDMAHKAHRDEIKAASKSSVSEGNTEKKVLIVDDLGVITFQLEMMFIKNNYEVTVSQEIYDAISKFKNGHFDFWPSGFFDEWDEAMLDLL